jgi:hypothetical protein
LHPVGKRAYAELPFERQTIRVKGSARSIIVLRQTLLPALYSRTSGLHGREAILSATRQNTSFSSLPVQPSLEHLRKDAKRRLARLRAGGASAQLADAQLLLAREYGFSSWRALKASIETCGQAVPHFSPPLNHHRAASAHTTMLDRVGLENAFFNFIALGMFLACMAMTVDFGRHAAAGHPAPVKVYVEFVR